VLALLAGGWVTPDRVARAVADLLRGGDLLGDPTADDVLDLLERRARRERRAGGPGATDALAGRLAELGAAVHVVGATGYPPRLAQAWPGLGAPLWVLVRAPASIVPTGPAVAVVGTRHPSLDGLQTARELGALLGRCGVVVVSGLARGIDQAAHRGALAAGGSTVAVLGTGFDVDYPRGDGDLREEIAASGALVTEHRPDEPVRPRHFLARNRILSGLADVVVVVEGRGRSGALATARLAGEQGREVWAVPGSLHAPTSQAPLALIRDGASVVTHLDDVVQAVLGVATRAHPPPHDGAADRAGTAARLSPAARCVLALLGAQPASPGRLADATGLPIPAVLAAVAELQGAGWALSAGRGIIRRGQQSDACG
jgi:DNA processing protein